MKYGELFDSHVHITNEIYKKEDITVDSYIEENAACGVKYFVNVCTKFDEIDEIYKSTAKYKHLYASIGIHPLYVKNILNDDEIKWFKQLIHQNRKIVAIGETGLDYYHTNAPDHNLQKKVFSQHLEIAASTKKPVIIHCREAWDDLYAIASEFKNSVIGVLHCFTGSIEDAKRFIDLGYYISFAGQITFQNKKIDQLRKVFKQIHLAHILIETDGPYLAPSPYRGQINKSKYLSLIVNKMAEIKNLSPQQIAQITTINAKKLFLHHIV